MAWIYLIIAVLFEVSFTTTLRFVDGFKNTRATATFLLASLLSLFSLETAARSIPLGTAYSIWTGVGTIGTVGIGMICFGEPATLIQGLLITGIVGCTISLKLTSGQ